MTKILIDVNALKEDVNNADVVVMDKQIFNAIIDAQDVVEERPTGEWIPVEDRLPEDRRVVLVTAYWHETYQVMEACYFGDGEWWCVPYNNCGDHMQRLKPKAWMPLPKPYKEAEND